MKLKNTYEGAVNAQYAELMEYVAECGEESLDRTEVGTYSVFGNNTVAFPLWYTEEYGAKLPIISTKKVHIPSVVHELLWMISGSTNIKYLVDNKVSIWNAWADEKGELGPVYGAQWRNFNGEGVDQIKQLEHDLRTNPKSRRHILTAWNPAQLSKMALPPCHAFAQFYVDGSNNLHCQLYQRSADLFLGVPFNILQYSLLTAMLARVCGYGLGRFTHIFGDLHIYKNHIDQAHQLMERNFVEREDKVLYQTPLLKLPKRDSITEYTYADFEWVGEYIHGAHISALVAV